MPSGRRVGVGMGRAHRLDLFGKNGQSSVRTLDFGVCILGGLDAGDLQVPALSETRYQKLWLTLGNHRNPASLLLWHVYRLPLDPLCGALQRIYCCTSLLYGYKQGQLRCSELDSDLERS
jgi:hypothetical protein